ncbi:bacillithiol system redox-active protein YtxJ [Winogradskyella sp. R77965]|uniref:bacillithiol system redox-active protein YtxJ n=1 Tax=Winogradskyella sp. R77965 TaxID=3093872 RepID=UPI0037DDD2A3
MGIFNKMFGSSSEPSSSAKASKNKKEEKILPWIALNSVEQLDTIAEKSKTKTQLIFKHSTRCGISRMVMNQFVSAYDVNANADLYYLDLLSYRDVSNEVGFKFQVMHQSPQLLVLRNGVVVAHASHGGIIEMDLEKFL